MGVCHADVTTCRFSLGVCRPQPEVLVNREAVLAEDAQTLGPAGCMSTGGRRQYCRPADHQHRYMWRDNVAFIMQSSYLLYFKGQMNRNICLLLNSIKLRDCFVAKSCVILLELHKCK